MLEGNPGKLRIYVGREDDIEDVLEIIDLDQKQMLLRPQEGDLTPDFLEERSEGKEILRVITLGLDCGGIGVSREISKRNCGVTH